MTGASAPWIGAILALLTTALPLVSSAAPRFVVLEHYTNFR